MNPTDKLIAELKTVSGHLDKAVPLPQLELGTILDRANKRLDMDSVTLRLTERDLHLIRYALQAVCEG